MLAAAAVLGGVIGNGWIGVARVDAQMNREAEMIGLHQLCERGDRRACVRFGILIGENRERHAEWRRLHADWWWWER